MSAEDIVRALAACDEPIGLRWELERCPKCGNPVCVYTTLIPAEFMTDIPPQEEEFVRLSAWQCYEYKSHHGQVSDAVDAGSPSLTPVEIGIRRGR